MIGYTYLFFIICIDGYATRVSPVGISRDIYREWVQNCNQCTSIN